jgi:hypothetical protein
MRIFIELDVDEELVEEDGSGLSEPGFLAITEALLDFGEVGTIAQLPE